MKEWARSLIRRIGPTHSTLRFGWDWVRYDYVLDDQMDTVGEQL